MRLKRPLLLLLAALTAGCADVEPFAYPGDPIKHTVNKPRDSVLVKSNTSVCYSDKTPWDEVLKLGAEQCGAYGLKIHSYRVLRWNCRATAPHEVLFHCFDPEMVYDSGRPVNVFSEAEVAEWERRTGKTAKPHNNLVQPAPAAPATEGAPPQPAAPAAPPPAPVGSAPPPAPLAPLTPADIAGRPAIPAPPPRQPAPAPAPAEGAYPTDGFTLPQGSWGDHFQD